MENVLNLRFPKRWDFIRRFFTDCNEILFSPSFFFRRRFEGFKIQDLLVLGILSSWIAGIIAFVWETIGGAFLHKILAKSFFLYSDFPFELMESNRREFLYDAGFLVAFPFYMLLRLALSACLLWFLAALFIPARPGERPLSWKLCLKIVAGASIGNWFDVVPFIGGLLSIIAVIVLTVIGVRECFSVSYRRASLVVLLPRLAIPAFLFFIGILLGGTLFIAGVASG